MFVMRIDLGRDPREGWLLLSGLIVIMVVGCVSTDIFNSIYVNAFFWEKDLELFTHWKLLHLTTCHWVQLVCYQQTLGKIHLFSWLEPGTPLFWALLSQQHSWTPKTEWASHFGSWGPRGLMGYQKSRWEMVFQRKNHNIWLTWTWFLTLLSGVC